MAKRVEDLIYGRPTGVTLPVKMRQVCKVVIWCQPKKRVTFIRWQVETPYTNPHIYTGQTYPKNKGKMKEIEPEHGASKDDMARLRRALTTLGFRPGIDLENNQEIWRMNDEVS